VAAIELRGSNSLGRGVMLRSTSFFFLFSPYNSNPSRDSFLDPFLVARILGFPLTRSYYL